MVDINDIKRHIAKELHYIEVKSRRAYRCLKCLRDEKKSRRWMANGGDMWEIHDRADRHAKAAEVELYGYLCALRQITGIKWSMAFDADTLALRKQKVVVVDSDRRPVVWPSWPEPYHGYRG